MFDLWTALLQADVRIESKVVGCGKIDDNLCYNYFLKNMVMSIFTNGFFNLVNVEDLYVSAIKFF